MIRNNVIEIKKQNYTIDFRQSDGSFIQEDSYEIVIGITYSNGRGISRSIGELTKDELIQIKNEIEKII